MTRKAQNAAAKFNKRLPSARQCDVLASIVQLSDGLVRMPTVRELCAAEGGKAPSGMKRHLDALRRKGFIDWSKGAHRSIRVIKGIPLLGEVR